MIRFEWSDHAKARSLERFGLEWLDMPHFDPADLTKAMQVPYGDGDRVWLVVDKVRYVLQRVAPSKYIIVTVWHTRTEAPSYAKRVRRRKRKDGQARNGCELVAEDGSS